MLLIDSVDCSIGNNRILNSIFLQCAEHEVVGLLGRNGSGKSTLLKIIFGTINATHKHLKLDDSVTESGYKDSRINYLPQQAFLPGNEKIKNLAELFIDDSLFEEFKKEEIFVKYNKNTISQLSGGERRVLETYFVLYSKAKYLLLDEPFSFIAPLYIEKIKELMAEMAERGKGIIITDHSYRNVLDVSDRLYLLQTGNLFEIEDNRLLVDYGYVSSIDE